MSCPNRWDMVCLEMACHVPTKTLSCEMYAIGPSNVGARHAVPKTPCIEIMGDSEYLQLFGIQRKGRFKIVALLIALEGDDAIEGETHAFFKDGLMRRILDAGIAR